MDYIQVVAALCAIVEQETRLLQTMAEELAQHGAVDHAEEVAACRRAYSAAMGEEVAT